MDARFEPERFPSSPIDRAENIIETMPNRPEIKHSATCSGPFYRPSVDVVTLPDRDRFETPEFYYRSTFHELSHSTGHPSRLDRFKTSDELPCGASARQREELVAEMSAAFLCATAGIEQTTETLSAAYVSGWLNAFRADSRLFVSAASQAQRSADFIIGKQPAAASIAA